MQTPPLSPADHQGDLGKRSSRLGSQRRSRRIILPSEYNADVPQLSALRRDKTAFLRELEQLYIQKGCKPPLVLIQSEGCFTNEAMMTTLAKVLGAKNVNKYVSIHSIHPGQSEFPPPEADTIYIIGGSLDDAYTPSGQLFIGNFCLPLLEHIQSTSAAAALGTCYGHQTLMEAFGRLADIPIETKLGKLQFGFYLIDIKGGHPALDKIRTGLRRVVFTRTGWTELQDGRPFSDLTDVTIVADFPLPLQDHNPSLVPPGTSYLDGKVLTFQPHVEIPFEGGLIEHLVKYFDSKISNLQAGDDLSKCPDLTLGNDHQNDLSAAIFVLFLRHSVLRLLER